MQITVYTIDGEHEKTVNLHPSINEWDTFASFVATYIDTEGQPFGSGGYVVQLIDDQDNVLAEETQESYTI